MPADIIIGADAQPNTNGLIVIGTTTANGDIIIGNAPQPNTNGLIVIGDAADPDAGSANLITFDIPQLPKGTVVLALVVRDANPVTARAGWTKVIDGVGASGLFLDGWARMLDDDDARGETEDAALAAFLSEIAQPLQGHLLVFDNTSPAWMVEAVQHAAIAADVTPTAPSVLSQQASNYILAVFSVAGAIDLDAPVGFDIEEEYTSDHVSERTIFVASKVGNASGTLALGDGSASPAATGRAWSIVVRNNPPMTPVELHDTVPGHIGLIGVK